MSIIVGAVVAAITTLLQGTLDLLKHWDWNLSGSAAAVLYHFNKTGKA